MDVELRGSQWDFFLAGQLRYGNDRTFIVSQAVEERGEWVGISPAEWLSIDEAEYLRPGGPGIALVRLRAIGEARQVAAAYEGVDLLRAEGLRRTSVDPGCVAAVRETGRTAAASSTHGATGRGGPDRRESAAVAPRPAAWRGTARFRGRESRWRGRGKRRWDR